MEKFLALSIKKQDTIRNAALACFAKHGYEKASINDIAVAAGISKASIFQYFGNKQALYQYLFDYCAAQMKQAFLRGHRPCENGKCVHTCLACRLCAPLKIKQSTIDSFGYLCYTVQ